eukprot:scaffold10505_cov102-Isochrysis_galbana.AAC.8
MMKCLLLAWGGREARGVVWGGREGGCERATTAAHAEPGGAHPSSIWGKRASLVSSTSSYGGPADEPRQHMRVHKVQCECACTALRAQCDVCESTIYTISMTSRRITGRLEPAPSGSPPPPPPPLHWTICAL